MRSRSAGWNRVEILTLVLGAAVLAFMAATLLREHGVVGALLRAGAGVLVLAAILAPVIWRNERRNQKQRKLERTTGGGKGP